jgi:hypothetical protein
MVKKQEYIIIKKWTEPTVKNPVPLLFHFNKEEYNVCALSV